MHPVEALHRHGGVASRARLLALTDWHSLERLVRTGEVIRDSRGRYSLPGVQAALRTANSLSAVVSHLSAAQHWGWELKEQPKRPHVTVPRNRNVSADQRRVVVPHWATLHADEIHGGIVTTRARTLLDCLQSVPFDQALTVADSALRHDDVLQHGLRTLSAEARGPGSRQARRVALLADERAANPFESVLRAIALDVRGLDLAPQQAIRAPAFFARPDLVDRVRMLVLEADSHTWHSSRAALRRDCRRYTGLTLRGWTVIRFAWEDVMFEPDYVRTSLESLGPGAQPNGQDRRLGADQPHESRSCPLGGRSPGRRTRGDAVSAATVAQRLTLPAFRQPVQTLSRFGAPLTVARTRWMFGSKRRFVILRDQGRLLPKPGFLAQMSQTAATVHSSC